MSMIGEILSSTYEIVRKEIARIVPTNRWATVTSVSPLRIKFDDQSQPLAATPGRLVSGLMVGDRVDVRHRNPGQPLITGVAGGGDTGWVDMPLAAGFTGSIRYRRVGDHMLISVQATGSYPVGATVLTRDLLPDALRPIGNVRGTGALNGNAAAATYTGAHGQIGFINSTGAARTGGEGTITYYLG